MPGILIGGICTIVTLAALISPNIFGIDRFLPEMRMASRRMFPSTDKIEAENGEVSITRPNDGWAKYKISQPSPDAATNVLILVSTADGGAYIGCQNVDVTGDEKLEDREKKVLAGVFKSDLLQVIGQLKGKPFNDADAIVSERKASPVRDMQEVTVDLRLGGIDRRMLIYYNAKDQLKSAVLVACARRARFESLEADFRKSFASFSAR